MSSRQGKGCPEMPMNQTEPAQYSQDSQSDSDHEFEVTAVNPNAESTRLDGIHGHPQDSHAPCHTRQKTDNMDQHRHQGAPSNQQGPYTRHSIAQPARKMRSDTSEVSWTKHEGTHGACPMTSEN